MKKIANKKGLLMIHCIGRNYLTSTEFNNIHACYLNPCGGFVGHYDKMYSYFNTRPFLIL